MAGGMHLAARYGRTVAAIEADGFAAGVLLNWLAESQPDPPVWTQGAKAMESAGAALQEMRPDAILLLGDRFETAAVALAATVVGLPIAHLHGGEETGGAFDGALRHAISKLAHLHLVSTRNNADRLVSIGEDPATIHIVGAPGIDNLYRDDLPGRGELETTLGIRLVSPIVLVTVHPTTLAPDGGESDALAVAETVDMVPATYVITAPNADPGADIVRQTLSRIRRKSIVSVRALGDRAYWGMLRIADAVLGNSSSALIEAPALGLPAVNVGDRQLHRDRARNVVDVAPRSQEVARALRMVLAPGYRDSLRDEMITHDGRAGERIARILANWRPPSPPRKAPIEMRNR
jgi:UDP-hydrolysing UDP-N-acetyl-D-glucosamine 2-epimerase